MLHIKEYNGRYIRAILYMMLAEVTQSLQDILIQFFISRKLGTDGLTAYGLAYPMLALMIGVSLFIVMGVHTVCARDMGAGKIDRARAHLSAGLTWGFLIMATLALLCNVFKRPLIMALGGAEVPAELMEMGMDALSFGLCSGPGFCLTCLLLTFLYFDRDRKRAVAMSAAAILTQCVSVAVSSSLFPTMRGVIFGYVLSSYLSAAIIFLSLRRGTDDSESPFRHLWANLDFSQISASLQTGLPELSAWVFYLVFAILRNLYILKIHSGEAVAVVTLSEGVNQIGELFMASAFSAILAIAGAAYGCGSRERYEKDVGMVFRQSAVLALAAGLIQAAMTWPVVYFTLGGESVSVRQMAVTALLSESVALVFYILNNVFIGTYEATGRLRLAHVNYFLEYLLFPVAFMLALGEAFGITGVWLGHPVSEAVLLLFNIGLAWKSIGHFPRRAEDFGFFPRGETPERRRVEKQ